jgi:hypothetical protein
MKIISSLMKTCLSTAGLLGLLGLALTAAPGQPSPPPGRPPSLEPLTRFDLDFPGGTPKDLVAAIQKSLGRPLNAIVPEEFATERLPALKMKNVNVSQLFDALRAASQKSENVTIHTGPAPGYPLMPTTSQFITSYGFRTQGPPSDDAIWCFFVERPVLPAPPAPQKVCRFYSLAPYLDHGATVDDITTAIETGWKMLGDNSPATIRFHKDTKLLIAVGEPSKLEIIDAVLKAIDVPKTKSGASAAASAAKPPEKPKTDE